MQKAQWDYVRPPTAKQRTEYEINQKYATEEKKQLNIYMVKN